MGVELAKREDTFHSFRTKDNLRSKVWELGYLRLEIAAFNTPFAAESSKDGAAELRTRMCHGECGGTFSALGIHDDGTCILNVLVEGRNLACLDGICTFV